jgi:3-hydroxyisobutyrate dehydrogenase-like beta-hydroxyacid dehydrogenase
MKGSINMIQKICMVGLGRMGANIARRLKEQGFEMVAVYDIDSQRASALAEELNASACDSLSEVTRLSDAVITVVSDDKAMRDIFGRDGDHLFLGAQGKLFLNCATVSPQVHIDLQREAASVGAQVLECPMASSITQAREGTLYLMCAGDEAVYQQAQPLLKAMALSSVYTGQAGSAAQIKALVNMVMNINTAGLAEGLGLAHTLGLDLELVRKIFSQTGANSRVLETDGEDMHRREHEPYFSAAHAAKDSGIALDLGQKNGLSLPLAEACKRQYDRMVSLGLGDLDKSGVSELTFQSRLAEHTQAAR